MNATEPVILQAHKTEYEGIVFKSKCEATFARNLTLMGMQWEYEPKRWKTSNGWIPDFRTIQLMKNHCFQECAIEYKPNLVTDSYLERIGNGIDEIIEVFSGVFVTVICGSVYNGVRKAFYYRGGGKWETGKHSDYFFKHLEEASRFRFDLKQPQ